MVLVLARYLHVMARVTFPHCLTPGEHPFDTFWRPCGNLLRNNGRCSATRLNIYRFFASGSSLAFFCEGLIYWFYEGLIYSGLTWWTFTYWLIPNSPKLLAKTAAAPAIRSIYRMAGNKLGTFLSRPWVECKLSSIMPCPDTKLDRIFTGKSDF